LLYLGEHPRPRGNQEPAQAIPLPYWIGYHLQTGDKVVQAVTEEQRFPEQFLLEAIAGQDPPPPFGQLDQSPALAQTIGAIY
jgi:hypothetical protein